MTFIKHVFSAILSYVPARSRTLRGSSLTSMSYLSLCSLLRSLCNASPIQHHRAEQNHSLHQTGVAGNSPDLLYSVNYPVSLFISLQLRLIPPYIQNLRFELNLTNLDLGPRSKQTFSYSTAVAIEFEYTFSRLVFNTNYLVSIRAEGRYQWCPNNRLVGNNSEEVTISTASSCESLLFLCAHANSCLLKT